MAFGIKQKLLYLNKHPFRTIGLLLLPFVLLAVGFYGVYIPIAGHYQQKQFALAEKDLTMLENKIIAKVGGPNTKTNDSSCGQVNMIYQKGPLSCDASTSLSYIADTPEEATLLMSKIAQLHQSPLRSGSIPISDRLTFEKTGTRQIYYQKLPAYRGLECGISYTYTYSQKPNRVLIIHFSCSGQAVKKIYPLKNI